MSYVVGIVQVPDTEYIRGEDERADINIEPFEFAFTNFEISVSRTYNDWNSFIEDEDEERSFDSIYIDNNISDMLNYNSIVMMPSNYISYGFIKIFYNNKDDAEASLISKEQESV